MKSKWIQSLIIIIFSFLSITGYSQCLNTNGDLSSFTGSNPNGLSGIFLNSWINNNLTNWNVSHGSPTYNSSSSQMWMWSFGNTNFTAFGEGVYTEYNFVAGTTYCITYDILKSSTSNPNSRFKAILTNGLNPYVSTNGSDSNAFPTSVGPTQQVSDLTWVNAGTFITITETFVANNNYSQLWLHPFLNVPASSPLFQAACTIDNVCIKVIPPPVVVGTQPILNVCTTDPPFTLGTTYGAATQTLPVNNVFDTNNFFTPTDIYVVGGTTANGAFTALPNGVTTATFLNSTGAFTRYNFDPNVIGPGSYIVEYTYTDQNTGLFDSAQMEIIVEAPPTVVFPDLTIDLCDYSGPVEINPFTSGTNCIVSGPFISSNKFDAKSAGVGIHIVQITCEPMSNCPTTIEGIIIVEQNDGWHNTTSNSVAPGNQGDSGNDIYTDKDGYVYSTGSFYKETTFRDSFGNSIGLVTTAPNKKKFYAVCYNDCGELQWVVYDTYQDVSHSSEGFGIVKNEDEIFVGVNYKPKAIFKTIYPNGTSFTFGGNAGGFAKPIGNVCLLAIDGPNTSSFGRVNAIDNTLTRRKGRALYSRPSGAKEIYVCGSSDLNNNLVPEVFFSKVKYSQSANVFSSIWNRKSSSESAYHVANDIVFNSENELIMITGSYSDDFNLLNASGVLVGFSSPAIKDAFFTTVNPDGYVSGLGIRKFGIGAGQEAEGTTITSSPGQFYIGGNYKGETSSPFSFDLDAAISYANSPYTNGFILSYKWSESIPKFENIWNTNSPITITGIDAHFEKVAFVGYYGNGVAQTTSGTIGSNPLTGNNQIFIGQIDSEDEDWYIPNLVNTTLNLNNGNHKSTRVSVGENGFSFITGTYRGRLSYLYGSPNSGDLGATGSNSSIYNAFFLRHDLETNQLRLAENKEKRIFSNSIKENVLDKDVLKLQLYPNPALDEITISTDNNTMQRIEIYSPDGKLVQNIKSNQVFQRVNISTLKSGIYLIKVYDISRNVYTSRFIKK